MAKQDRIDEFIRLFTRHEAALRSFVLMLLPRRADADEVLQETNLILWRKFDEFRPGTDFVGWARQIARYEAMRYRRTLSRDRLIFDDDLLHRIAEEASSMTGELDDRQDALSACMRKLAQADREVIALRYEAGMSTRDLAATIGRSVDATYKLIHRIRHTLFRCVEKTLATGEGVS